MKQIIIVILGFLLGLHSCKSSGKKSTGPHSDTSYYPNGKIDQIIRMDGHLLNGYHEVYYKEGGLQAKTFFVDGRPMGPSYEYFRSGKIERVKYLVGNDVYTYSKSFNEAGKVTLEEGTILVSDSIRSSDNLDTLFFRLLFFDFGLKKLLVEISPDARHYKSLTLRQSGIDHTLEAKGWKSVRNLDHTSFYLRMTATDSTGRVQTYYDMLSLKRPS